MLRVLCTILLLVFVVPVWGNVLQWQSSLSINSPVDIAIAPLGDQVYVANLQGNAIDVLNRDPMTGDINLVQTKSGDPGLVFPWRVAISNDGRFVYVITRGSQHPTASADDALLVYERATDGTLSWIETLQNGSGGVNELLLPSAIVISTTGDQAYVRSAGGNALLVFDRDAESGQLVLVQTLRESDVGVAGLNGNGELAVTTDGRFIYTTSTSDSSVTLFERSSVSKQLVMVKSYVNGGDDITAMGGAWGIALSPSQEHLYVSGSSDNSIVAFTRDEVSGTLSFTTAYHQGETNLSGDKTRQFDGLTNPASIQVSPDGQRIYASGQESGAPQTVSTLAVMRRDALDGSLSFIEVQRSSGTSPILGLGGMLHYALSNDGEYLYSAGIGDGNIGVFSHLMADLQMASTANAEKVEPGETFNYTLVVSNNSSGVANGVAVTDLLPVDVTYIGSDTPSCEYSTTVVHCELGSLLAGAQIVITFQLVAPDNEGQISNRALVYSQYNDNNPADNLRQLDTTVMRIVPNTAPIAVMDIAYTLPGQPVVVDVLANDSDLDGDGLTVLSVNKQSGTTQGALIVSSSSEVTYLPPAKQGGKDYNGVEYFTYIASDSNGGEVEGQLTVVVNTPPHAQDDAVSIVQGSSEQIIVLANDSDPDSNLITLSGIDASGLIGGVVQMNADGILIYSADTTFVGNDTFIYTIMDSNGGTSDAQVFVNVIAATASGGNAGNGSGNSPSLNSNDKNSGGGSIDPIFILMLIFFLMHSYHSRFCKANYGCVVIPRSSC